MPVPAQWNATLRRKNGKACGPPSPLQTYMVDIGLLSCGSWQHGGRRLSAQPWSGGPGWEDNAGWESSGDGEVCDIDLQQSPTHTRDTGEAVASSGAAGACGGHKRGVEACEEDVRGLQTRGGERRLSDAHVGCEDSGSLEDSANEEGGREPPLRAAKRRAIAAAAAVAAAPVAKVEVATHVKEEVVAVSACRAANSGSTCDSRQSHLSVW